ncbi:hypothetical protein E1B28_010613 [Marasmius oreades]|uniref:Fruit-body specific protein a n=1 Tax=Marasmius oreades TaxID=181124 RepID=A0A9P7URB4_9AGAR|nr:uncharacterized protein E1B28_010613 [Marasmius oreades]KAG7091592.1 hypothetical protein E1B28_010613 [Marasmius oreades]
MMFLTLVTAFAVTSVSATSVRFPNLIAKAELSAGAALSASNNFGSSIPPWQEGYSPAWYMGDNPDNAPELPWLKDRTLCTVLNKVPDSIHCPTFPLALAVRAKLAAPKRRSPVPQDPTVPSPATPSQPPPPPPPPGVYNPVFTNLDGAIEADDYMTFGLVDTIDDCLKMCDTVIGCGFVNTYHDVNGKDGSPLLTCSLYRSCHGPDQAINKGGQSQPDGSINFIRSSDGYCKQS